VDPAIFNGIAEIVVPTVSVVSCAVFGLFCFPSVRAALTERMRQRTLKHAEAVDIVAQLSTHRGELYALRGEIAEVRRALGPGTQPQGPALSSGVGNRSYSGS
jgi:hypothetical protein